MKIRGGALEMSVSILARSSAGLRWSSVGWGLQATAGEALASMRSFRISKRAAR